MSSENLLGQDVATTTVEAATGFFQKLLNKNEKVQDVVNWGRKWSF